MKTQIGITIADRGAAMVTVERRDEDALVVTAIERQPFDLDAVVTRVRELDAGDPETHFVIDAIGLGSALWTALGPPSGSRWQLYAAKGIERQALVDGLLVAVHEDRLHFAAGLLEQEAMTKALLAYRRQVKEDGLIGSELVVALLLAILPPRNPPMFSWGPSMFGPSEPRVRVLQVDEDGKPAQWGMAIQIAGDDDGD